MINGNANATHYLIYCFVLRHVVTSHCCHWYYDATIVNNWIQKVS